MSTELNQIQAVAVTLFAAALVERCGDMILRLTSPKTLAAEVAAFRDDALTCIKAAPLASNLQIADAADAVRIAAAHVDEICDAWLGKARGGIDEAQPLN